MAKTKQSSGSWGSLFGKKSEGTAKKEVRKDDKEIEKIEKKLKEERAKMKKEDKERKKERQRQEGQQEKEREKRRKELDKKLGWAKKDKKKHFSIFGDPAKKRRKKLEKMKKEKAEKQSKNAEKMRKARAKRAEENRKMMEKQAKELAKKRREEEKKARKMEKRSKEGKKEVKELKPERKIPEASRLSTEMPKGIRPKKILHDLYFSKKVDENATVKSIYRDMSGYEKTIERRLSDLENQTDRRVENIEKTMTMIRDIVDGLRRENEELRKDRQFFVEKYKASLNENALISSEEKVLEEAEAETEKRSPVVTSYAEHGTSKNVETSMDALLELVNKKGGIRLNMAAKRLGVKESEAEEWVHVLEEHGLIEVHYPTFGSPMLKKKGK